MLLVLLRRPFSLVLLYIGHVFKKKKKLTQISGISSLRLVWSYVFGPSQSRYAAF